MISADGYRFTDPEKENIDLKLSIETNLQKWGLTIAIPVSLLITILPLIHFTYPEPLSPSDTIQILTLVVLVIVTAWYAISTHRINNATTKQASVIAEQAKISERALQVALEAERNSALPVIELVDHQSVDSIQVEAKNLGRGPALNIIICLEYFSQDLNGVVTSSVAIFDVIGAGEHKTWVWFSQNELSGFPISHSQYRVVAEYTDIYRRPFRSSIRRGGPSYGQFEYKVVDA